jgi:hypothetical protein
MREKKVQAYCKVIIQGIFKKGGFYEKTGLEKVASNR